MIKTNGYKYKLVEYEEQTGDYMVLESLNQEKNTSRIIHIIRPSPQKDVFKLGRGHESDLRINDISVSRCHAKIKLEKGKFMLEDNQSKFGTLVLIKQRTPLLPGFNKAVQVGRTVINFSVKSINNPNSTARNALDQIQIRENSAGGILTNKILAPPIGFEMGQVVPSGLPVLQHQVTSLPDNNVNPMSTFQQPVQSQFPTNAQAFAPVVGNNIQYDLGQQMQTGANWNVGDEDF